MTRQTPAGGKTPLSKALQSAQLPAMPDSAMRLLAISNDPDHDAADLAKPIEADAALATQVLRFVNSSYFGFRSEIASVQQAIALLGTRKIKNFVMWNAVFGVVTDPKERGFSMTAFRCDALRRGVFARLLATRLKLGDAEQVFTAALLQDIAIPLLVKQFGRAYIELLLDAYRPDTRLADLERDAYGWTHAEAACLLLERWKLPEQLAGLIRTHEDAESLAGTADTEAGTEAGVVAVSALLPWFGEGNWCDAAAFDACWARLNAGDSAAMLAETDEAFRDLAQALSIGSAGKPLVELYEAATADCGA